MAPIIEVGVPVLSGPAQGWNFWPLLGIPIALIIAFRWLDLPRNPWLVVAAILIGLGSADAVAAWGVIPSVVAALVIVVAVRVALARVGRKDPPTV